MKATLPLRPTSAVLIAIGAQVLLEPPWRKVEIAVALYALAAALIVWTGAKNEWETPALPPRTESDDPIVLRPFPLLVSIPFLLAAFWAFGEGKFTPVNLALWFAAVALLIVALWVRYPKSDAPAMSALERERAWMRNALIVAAFGLVFFFRFNRIDEIPDQPFSDHAEKILDVYDVSQGQYSVFFPRNTGREALQIYWTWLIARLFGTGLSFLTLKIGTVLLGTFALPFVYLLGKEYGSPRAGLFALLLFGIAYWPNVMARMGLRFPLYPLFVAPTLFYLTRGLRARSQNDFLLCGFFLGLGLHGYTPFRVAPLLVLAVFAIGSRFKRDLSRLLLVGVVALYVSLPLLRYALDHPDIFSSRAFSRFGNLVTNLNGDGSRIFLYNLGRGLLMFNWDDGEIWINSLPHRPALDAVAGALFAAGTLFLIFRFARRRDARDLILLVSIPVLLLPSVLSLAFPNENPSLNRAGGAAISACLIAALALDGLATSLENKGQARAYALIVALLVASAYHNYDLVFRQFRRQSLLATWNTSEMGKTIGEFRAGFGQTDSVWIVPYPQWVDTRLPAIWAGLPNRDFALWREDFPKTLEYPAPKLFIFNPEDADAENALKELYPTGALTRYTLEIPGKDFMIFLVEP